MEEKFEFLNKELEFAKQRESQHRNKVQHVEDQKIAVQKELNSIKYDLQKQIARAEKAEASIAEKTVGLNNKNAIIRTMTEETKQIKMDLQRCKEEAKKYCFKFLYRFKRLFFICFFILFFRCM